MKRIIIICFLLVFFYRVLDGQVVGIKVGQAYTSMHGFFKYKSRSNTPLFVEYDHDIYKNIGISTELGFLYKGGKTSAFTDESGKPIPFDLYIKTLEINAAVRCNIIKKKKWSLCCKIGPRLDIHLENNYKTQGDMKDILRNEDISKKAFGAVTGLSVNYDYAKLRIGLSYLYNWDFTNTDIYGRGTQ